MSFSLTDVSFTSGSTSLYVTSKLQADQFLFFKSILTKSLVFVCSEWSAGDLRLPQKALPGGFALLRCHLRDAVLRDGPERHGFQVREVAQGPLLSAGPGRSRVLQLRRSKANKTYKDQESEGKSGRLAVLAPPCRPQTHLCFISLHSS